MFGRYQTFQAAVAHLKDENDLYILTSYGQWLFFPSFLEVARSHWLSVAAGSCFLYGHPFALSSSFSVIMNHQFFLWLPKIFFVFWCKMAKIEETVACIQVEPAKILYILIFLFLSMWVGLVESKHNVFVMQYSKCQGLWQHCQIASWCLNTYYFFPLPQKSAQGSIKAEGRSVLIK